MGYGSDGFDQDDGAQRDFTAPDSRWFRRQDGPDGRDAAPASSGRKGVSQRDLEAVRQRLRAEIAADVQRQIESAAARTDRRLDEVLAAVRGLSARLEAVARNVDSLMDALRDQGVRDAIDGGRATSDFHRRHLDLAQSYGRLVQQDLRMLVRPLCPRLDGEGEAELARRRAMVVGELVMMLFHPLDQPVAVSQEDIVAELRDHGLATGAVQFRAQFDAVFRRAGELRDGVAALPFTAHLDTGVDPAALRADQYQPWNRELADTGRPEFVVAHAYVVAGDRPQALTQPIVFLAPTAPAVPAAPAAAS
ncbi:hypothetical protein [Actinacidiphila acididurans]|uniref:Uncharacterized protein n=1 Tax=Actinacidiphila acididurans TaxID=2784346 RepID=A0ABS2TX65_9ACTN|nr:hypothetical protein [Actinacidiphila acididurans]MBM9507943.1 hypothetical protein [Actinacidiphila acididurans]